MDTWQDCQGSNAVRLLTMFLGCIAIRVVAQWRLTQLYAVFRKAVPVSSLGALAYEGSGMKDALSMEQIGKLIFLLGTAFAVLGLVVWGFGKIGFKGLPGDIRYESDNFVFYFPIVTCLVLSLVLTLLVWVWQVLRK
jgi:hypothetical protein